NPTVVAESIQDEWLWGWDPTPGIVSVWAEPSGRATVWRRDPRNGALIREEERFRPWLVLDGLGDLRHIGDRLQRESLVTPGIGYREREGPSALRYQVWGDNWKMLTSAVLYGASRRLGRPLASVRELGGGSVLVLSPEEQYLVATGRTYFRDLSFDHLRRLQF